MWLHTDKRLQSDQKDINWEFLDDKELTKHGNSAVGLVVAMCSVGLHGLCVKFVPRTIRTVLSRIAYRLSRCELLLLNSSYNELGLSLSLSLSLSLCVSMFLPPANSVVSVYVSVCLCVSVCVCLSAMLQLLKALT